MDFTKTDVLFCQLFQMLLGTLFCSFIAFECCGEKKWTRKKIRKNGTPGRIRTCDLQLRRLTPYPLGYGRKICLW